MKVFRTCLRGALVLVLCWVGFSSPAGAYSVLSHEEVVDMAWLPHIVPLLRARYPGLTDDDLRKAHAYAYGGSVIQDIGYYPFGSHDFSDLLHYVRTGDFVLALLREASNANEYAFALGALAHYCGDVDGHPLINQVTADEYPKLRRQFGAVVTYGENPIAHLRTEFGFDVVEVAHGRYSQENYRDFIGFQVSKELLEKAFLETYGVPVDSIMKHEDLAIGSYRRSVSTLIPKMTAVALVSYKDQIEKENPGFDHKKFVYRLRRTEFEQQYGKEYARPGLGSRTLAFFVRILPKIGPLKAFEIKVPNGAEQDLYLKGMNRTVDMYDGYLREISAGSISAGSTGAPSDLHEIDLDTGKPSQLGEYRLADQAYAKLLAELVKDPKAAMTPDVQQSLVDFYAVRREPAWYLKKPKQWQQLEGNLQRLDARTKPAPAALAALR
jgi:hypothetical protein